MASGRNREEVHSMYLGPGGVVASANMETLQYPDQLGCKFRVGDKWYQLVKCYGSATEVPAATQVAHWQDLDDYVAAGPTDGEGGLATPAGIWLSAVSRGYYGFIQKTGKATVQSVAVGKAGDLALPTSTGVKNASSGQAGIAIPAIGCYLASAGAGSAVSVNLWMRDY